MNAIKLEAKVFQTLSQFTLQFFLFLSAMFIFCFMREKKNVISRSRWLYLALKNWPFHSYSCLCYLKVSKYTIHRSLKVDIKNFLIFLFCGSLWNCDKLLQTLHSTKSNDTHSPLIKWSTDRFNTRIFEYSLDSM